MRRLVLLAALAVLLAGCSGGGPTPTPTASPELATATATATPSPSPSPTPSPTPTPTATPTAVPTPTPTATPTPTPTPTPTATPQPDVEFDPYWDREYTDGAEYYRHTMGGTLTNNENHAITLTVYPKLYESEDCEPDYTFEEQNYTVTLNPGESWSPPERWEETITTNYDFTHYTILPDRDGC